MSGDRLCIGAALFGALALGAMGVPGPARADVGFTRAGNVPVGQRPLPGYEALGIHSGPFYIYPRMSVSVDRDSNIYATESDTISDVIVGVSPEIDVSSNWARHSLSLSAGPTFVRYADHKSENTDDWLVSATGKLDINRELNASLNLSHQRSTEPRSSSAYDVSTLQSPIRYNVSTANLSAAFERDRWHVSTHIQEARWRYADVNLGSSGVFSQEFRDRNEDEGVLRVDYALTPSIAVFTEGSLSRTRYLVDTLANGDADQRSILAGVDMELTNLVTGEISFGHLTHDFRDPVTSNISSEHYRALIRWFPTQLVTVTLSGGQQVSDSGLQSDAALLSRNVAVRADYELLRNLIINGWSKYSNGRYQSLDRRDRMMQAGVGVNYLMNRTVGLNLHYSYGKQESSGSARGRQFTDNSVGLTLVLQH